jgi:maltooligosyltrehalose trehalohydrolase
MQREPDHPPQGALPQADGGVLWRLWAPLSDAVALVTYLPAGRVETEMVPQGEGYFILRDTAAREGLPYTFRLADGGEYPDPASRWQPQGVHRPSAVFFPQSYRWSDQRWRGVAREDLVIYELHTGAFTPEGTFDAIVPRLPQLAALGVTAIELMPVAQFPGDRNWGYDGVHPYAVQNSYGGPHGLQRLVDAAHRHGLAVLLDVVYNHLGPEGNYLAKFGPYFTERYHTPWGSSINYDGPGSDAVRQFVIDNACAWVRDFHLDGFRLDAVQTMYDLSPRHILADIQAAVQAEAARAGRTVHVIAESNQNDARLLQPPAVGGYGLDGVWSDDFHHSLHALLTGQQDGFYMDFGRAEHLAKAISEVFVYDGCYSRYHRRRHGTRIARLDRTRFVICVQNHDQLGNSASGARLGAMVPPPAQRLAVGLLMLSPCVPLLLMGEEYAEERPFPFFCSFGDAALAAAVWHGRRKEFASLRFYLGTEIPDPQAPETFAAAKLAWTWPPGSPHAQRRQLYQDLLAARRRWPALGDRRHTAVRLVEGAEAAGVPGDPTLLMVHRGAEGELLALANLAPQEAPLKGLDLAGRRPVLSTEDIGYGGARRLGQSLDTLGPYELIVFAPRDAIGRFLLPGEGRGEGAIR